MDPSKNYGEPNADESKCGDPDCSDPACGPDCRDETSEPQKLKATDVAESLVLAMFAVGVYAQIFSFCLYAFSSA